MKLGAKSKECDRLPLKRQDIPKFHEHIMNSQREIRVQKIKVKKSIFNFNKEFK